MISCATSIFMSKALSWGCIILHTIVQWRVSYFYPVLHRYEQINDSSWPIYNGTHLTLIYPSWVSVVKTHHFTFSLTSFCRSKHANSYPDRSLSLSNLSPSSPYSSLWYFWIIHFKLLTESSGRETISKINSVLIPLLFISKYFISFQYHSNITAIINTLIKKI